MSRHSVTLTGFWVILHSDVGSKESEMHKLNLNMVLNSNNIYRFLHFVLLSGSSPVWVL